MYTKKGSVRRKLRSIYKRISTFLQYKNILHRDDKHGGKIFCIGYIKTGTKSIGYCLKELGYDHLSFNPYVAKDFQESNFKKLIQYASKFDSFDDIPWNDEKLIPILDKSYPNSKFIYLIREDKDWMSSFKNWTHYLTEKEINYDDWFKRFVKHKEFVDKYFSEREEDIIRINVKNNEDFAKLLRFLNKTSSLKEFPHLNKTRL